MPSTIDVANLSAAERAELTAALAKREAKLKSGTPLDSPIGVRFTSVYGGNEIGTEIEILIEEDLLALLKSAEDSFAVVSGTIPPHLARQSTSRVQARKAAIAERMNRYRSEKAELESKLKELDEALQIDTAAIKNGA